MGAAAAVGRRALQEPAPPTVASDAFASIQQQGRETLARMRRVVGTLLDPEPPAVSPQPSLSQLDALLARAGTADVHLHVSGTPKELPSGLELSAYRTLEHLLDAYREDPGQRIDIDVDFAAEALTARTRGPVPAAVDRQAALGVGPGPGRTSPRIDFQRLPRRPLGNQREPAAARRCVTPAGLLPRLSPPRPRSSGCCRLSSTGRPPAW